MDDTIAKTIIAVIAAMVGGITKEFSPVLRSLLIGEIGTNSDLIGKWNCTWVVREGDKEQDEIQDRVDVFRVRGEQAWAKGINTKYGGYKMRGRISKSSLVTLHYEGVERMQPLGGVVIMRLHAMRHEMHGFWYEFGREEKITGGSTIWKRELS